MSDGAGDRAPEGAADAGDTSVPPAAEGVADPPADGDGDGEVTVVGTAHVSADSVEEVEATIERERPDVVAVELDEGRYRQLQGEAPDDLRPGDLLEGNTVFQFIAYWMLSYAQTRLGERFDIEPGADMLAAVDTAEALGIDVALVDRDIQTTIQRFWARMSALEKLRMAGALVFGVTDPRVVGVVLGLLVGVLLGPAVGLFGGAVGITAPLLARVTTGVVLAVVAGVAVDRLAAGRLDADRRLALAAGSGVAAGALGGVGLGLGVDLVAGTLGGFLTRTVGSLALGLVGGLAVGVAVAVAVDALDLLPESEEIEELEMAELTDADVVSVLMDEFREFSPGGAAALIDERDAYIAHKLIELRRRGADVVAVVGAGHREGIEAYLRAPETLPAMESLTGTTRGRGVPWLKLVGVAVSLGFLAFFVLLAMAGVRDGLLLRLFGAWFLINGAFAFGLAKLAGARWVSAGVGGGVAWMTSVNPLLAPGWFAGYVELRHTPINVGDIDTLNDLLADEEKPVRQLVSELFDVPLFRLIMVVAATNVGSVIASALFLLYVVPAFAAQLPPGACQGVPSVLGMQVGTGTTVFGVDLGTNPIPCLMVEGAVNSAESLWGAVA